MKDGWGFINKGNFCLLIEKLISLSEQKSRCHGACAQELAPPGFSRGSRGSWHVPAKWCHHKRYIQADNIFYYMFHLGLPGECL